jgi:uncharacterized protein (TIGR00369 family)
MSSIPEGFGPHFRQSPVTDPWEPLFSRQREGAVDLFFEIRPPHCNSRGFLHGGVLATLCDNAMGMSLAIALAEKMPHILTINLGIDYLDGARVGDGVTIEPRVLRSGNSTGFCDALVKVAARPIARANACFRILLRDAASS